MTRNPKNFYVLVCWTRTEEIGMVQRFDGIIYCLFVLTGDVNWTVEVNCLNGPSIFLAQGNLLLPIIVRYAHFFRPLLICLDMECTFF